MIRLADGTLAPRAVGGEDPGITIQRACDEAAGRGGGRVLLIADYWSECIRQFGAGRGIVLQQPIRVGAGVHLHAAYNANTADGPSLRYLGEGAAVRLNGETRAASVQGLEIDARGDVSRDCIEVAYDGRARYSDQMCDVSDCWLIADDRGLTLGRRDGGEWQSDQHTFRNLRISARLPIAVESSNTDGTLIDNYQLWSRSDDEDPCCIDLLASSKLHLGRGYGFLLGADGQTWRNRGAVLRGETQWFNGLYVNGLLHETREHTRATAPELYTVAIRGVANANAMPIRLREISGAGILIETTANPKNQTIVRPITIEDTAAIWQLVVRLGGGDHNIALDNVHLSRDPRWQTHPEVFLPPLVDVECNPSSPLECRNTTIAPTADVRWNGQPDRSVVRTGRELRRALEDAEARVVQLEAHRTQVDAMLAEMQGRLTALEAA